MEGLQYDLSSLVKRVIRSMFQVWELIRDSDGNTNKDVEFGSTTDVGYTITYNVSDKDYRVENVILSGADVL